MSNTKNTLKFAAIGAVSMIGSMSQGFATAAQGSCLVQIERGLGATTISGTGTTAAASAVIGSNFSANGTERTLIYTIGSDATSSSLTAGSVSAATNPVKSLDVWLNGDGTSTATNTVVLGASSAMPGMHINIWDSSGGSATTVVTTTALSLDMSGLSSADSQKIAPKDCVLTFHGPSKPASFDTAGVPGVKMQFKRKSYVEVAEAMAKSL